MELKTKHDSVVELVNKLFVYTDNREWSKLISEVFKEEILFDMSSAGAGAAEKKKARDICKMWDEGFAGIDHVHHHSGNFIVNFKSEVEAEIFCYATASHYKASATKGKTREFVGSYNLHAALTDEGWRLNSFRYNLKYITGNADLL